MRPAMVFTAIYFFGHFFLRGCPSAWIVVYFFWFVFILAASIVYGTSVSLLHDEGSKARNLILLAISGVFATYAGAQLWVFQFSCS